MKNLDLFHLYSFYKKTDSQLVSCLEKTVIECINLHETDTYLSFCTEITKDLPDKNDQRRVLKIILYSGRHLKRQVENTKLLNDAKVASRRFFKGNVC